MPLESIILFSIVCIAFLLAIWVKEDANSRGKPGWLVALMVLSTGGISGLLIWLVFRPEKK